jgi:hypothetical protein
MKIRPSKIRRWVHDWYAALAVALLITGFLITYPDLRSAVLGRYGFYMPEIHNWAGGFFIGLPIVGAFFRGKENWTHLKKRMFNMSKIQWRQIHLSGTWIAGITFALSGLILWWEKGIPLFIMDAMFAIHLWLAWLFLFATLYHLIAARRAIVVRVLGYFKK